MKDNDMTKRMLAIGDVLDSENYYTKVYIPLSNDLSAIEALVFWHMYSLWKYYAITKKLVDDGYFYRKTNRIGIELGMPATTLRRAITSLKRKGILSVKRMWLKNGTGISVNYYRPSIEKLISVAAPLNQRFKDALGNNQPPSENPSNRPLREDIIVLKKNINNNNNILSFNKLKDNRKLDSFQTNDKKSSVNKRRRFNALNRIKVKRIIFYWNSKGKPINKCVTGKRTKAERKIKKKSIALFKQGYSYNDFKFAIDAWHELLTSTNLSIIKQSTFYRKQSLGMFLFISSNERRVAENHRPPLNLKDSPFKTSTKGLQHLLNKFERRRVEKSLEVYKDMAQKIEEFWVINFYTLPSAKRDFYIAAKKWCEFCKENMGRLKFHTYAPDDYLHVFLEGLQEFAKPRDSGLLRQGFLYKDQLTRYLIDSEWMMEDEV